jgi:NAD(P)H-dependent FMN reductase
MKKILVILGSTRQGRKGELVSNWLMAYLKNHPSPDLTFDLSDLRTEALPILDSPINPSTGQYPEG